MNYSIICISQPVQGGGGGGCFLGDVDYVVQLCCFSGRADCVCVSCRGPSAAHHSTAVFDLVNAMNSSPPMITYDWISKGRYWLSCAVSRETYHPAWPHAESERYDILYRVGLRRKQGQSLWVRNDSFSNGQPYLRVEELARRLVGDTGLQIVEIDVAQSKWH